MPLNRLRTAWSFHLPVPTSTEGAPPYFSTSPASTVMGDTKSSPCASLCQLLSLVVALLTSRSWLADDNFIDDAFVRSANLPIGKMDTPRPVSVIDGRLLKTETLSLNISGNHHEHLRFLVISSPSSTMVLGLPWLKIHNPHIDWVSGFFLGSA